MSLLIHIAKYSHECEKLKKRLLYFPIKKGFPYIFFENINFVISIFSFKNFSIHHRFIKIALLTASSHTPQKTYIAFLIIFWLLVR